MILATEIVLLVLVVGCALSVSGERSIRTCLGELIIVAMCLAALVGLEVFA